MGLLTRKTFRGVKMSDRVILLGYGAIAVIVGLTFGLKAKSCTQLYIALVRRLPGPMRSIMSDSGYPIESREASSLIYTKYRVGGLGLAVVGLAIIVRTVMP